MLLFQLNLSPPSGNNYKPIAVKKSKGGLAGTQMEMQRLQNEKISRLRILTEDEEILTIIKSWVQCQ